MLTKKDITLLIVAMKEVFATKDDLKALESRMNDRFATKNDIIEFKDAILHEIVKLRDEVAIVGGQRDMRVGVAS